MYLEELTSIINHAFLKSGYNIDCKVIPSDRKDLCDYQCNDIFKVAKQYHKNPMEVGEEIVNNLNNNPNITQYFKKIEFVRPGFINLTLSDEFINRYVRITHQDIKKHWSYQKGNLRHRLRWSKCCQTVTSVI